MNGAISIAQLMGGVRRLAALAHSARDEETVLRALRYELHYALDVDEVRFEPADDEHLAVAAAASSTAAAAGRSCSSRTRRAACPTRRSTSPPP